MGSENRELLQVLEQYPDEVENRNKRGNSILREVINTDFIGQIKHFLKAFSKVGFQPLQQRSLPHVLLKSPMPGAKLPAAS